MIISTSRFYPFASLTKCSHTKYKIRTVRNGLIYLQINIIYFNDTCTALWLIADLGPRFTPCEMLLANPPSHEGDAALSCLPTVANGTVLTQTVVGRHAECMHLCLQENCLSFYLHWTNRSCVTHSSPDPQWFVQIDDSAPAWRFLVIT